MKKAVEELRRAEPTFVNSVRAKVAPVHALDFQEHLKRLAAHAEKHDRRVDDANANPSWSEQGRAQERASAGEDLRRDVAALVEAYSGTLDRRRADGLAALIAKVTPRAPSDPGERIALELTYREIRDSVKLLTPADRDMVFEHSNDPVVTAALSTGVVLSRTSPTAVPQFVPLISPAKVAAKLAARARAAAGSEAVGELESFELMSGAYRALAGFVIGAIQDSGPRPSKPVDARTGKPVTTGA
jgi:hypothetical protein